MSREIEAQDVLVGHTPGTHITIREDMDKAGPRLFAQTNNATFIIIIIIFLISLGLILKSAKVESLSLRLC